MSLRLAGCTYLHSSYWSVSVDNNNITAPTKLSSLCPKRLLQRKLFAAFVCSLTLSLRWSFRIALPCPIDRNLVFRLAWFGSSQKLFGIDLLGNVRASSAILFYLVGIGSTACVIALLQVCHRPWMSSSSGWVSFSSSGFLFWGSISYFSSLSFLVKGFFLFLARTMHQFF